MLERPPHQQNLALRFFFVVMLSEAKGLVFPRMFSPPASRHITPDYSRAITRASTLLTRTQVRAPFPFS